MPDMSGFQLRKQLEEKGLDLPLVFITGRDDGELWAQIESSSSFCLRKPVDDETLIDTIRL